MKTEGKDFIYFRTPEECFDLDGIVFEKGNGAADLKNPERPRDFDYVYDNIIVPAMERGEIGDGVNTAWDDRKIRYSGSRVEGDKLIISVGPTWYGAHKADLERGYEGNRSLMEKGVADFNDPYAYFASSLGVCLVPITSQGNTFLGVREGGDVAGSLNCIAGHMNFNLDISKISARAGVFKELDEYGMTEADVIQMEVDGIAANPLSADGDITFIGGVDRDDDYFASGEWKGNVKGEKEHGDLMRVRPEEIRDLLEYGKIPGTDKRYNVMYSTRLGLEAMLGE